MSIHTSQIERGIREIAIGLFRIRRDDGDDAYEAELDVIISYFTDERVSLMKQRMKKSSPLDAALDAVSRIGCSIAVDNDFKEGVEAAFPNCNEEMDHLEYKEAMRGKECE